VQILHCIVLYCIVQVKVLQVKMHTLIRSIDDVRIVPVQRSLLGIEPHINRDARVRCHCCSMLIVTSGESHVNKNAVVDAVKKRLDSTR